jgi:hypothetical protein
MADEPMSPQQLIDDAAKALGETPLPADENVQPHEPVADTASDIKGTSAKPETHLQKKQMSSRTS